VPSVIYGKEIVNSVRTLQLGTVSFAVAGTFLSTYLASRVGKQTQICKPSMFPLIKHDSYSADPCVPASLGSIKLGTLDTASYLLSGT
jgi:hypothetical protein